MSVWSGTIPNQRPRWVLLILALIAALFTDPIPNDPDDPDDIMDPRD